MLHKVVVAGGAGVETAVLYKTYVKRSQHVQQDHGGD